MHCIKIFLLAITLWALTGCDSCNPRSSNIALIGFSDFEDGLTYTLVADAPGSQVVPLRARVYYPSYQEDAIQAVLEGQPVDFEDLEVAEGNHPLIIFGHGQYGNGTNENFKGMTNLMYHLASWGYICVSIDLDVVHGSWLNNQHGIPHRAELFLAALEEILSKDTDSDSPFYNRIDETKIGFIGHSRGGGGAISAVNMNASQPSPKPILALATISPVDFDTDALQEAVPHLSIYGSWDGDLFDGEGPRIWDGGVRDADKIFVEIYGANHFHFTDAIDYWAETNEIEREEHQEMAQGFINAFFDKYQRGLNRYEWPLYLTGTKKVQPVDYYLQYLSKDFTVIDDGVPLGTVNSNTLGGMNDGTTLSQFEDKMLTNHSEHFYNQSEGLIVHWDNANDEVVFNFPAQDVNTYTHLHLRISQRPDIPLLNTVDMLKNFTVEINDQVGGSSTIAAKDYLGGLQYPDFSQSIQDKVDANPAAAS